MDNAVKQKIKVTHVTRYAYPHVGGIEAVISQINECLPDVQYEKEVLCCSNTEKSSIENGVKYNRCKFLFEFAANTISPEFIWKLSKVDADILHYHMPFIFAVIAHFIAKPKYKKLYISYHGAIVGYDKFMWPFWGLYKYFYKIADKIHVLSPDIINKDKILTDNKEKCLVIPYGIEVINNKASLQEETEHYKKQFNNKKIILCVGRLARMKGLLNAIKAMKLVEGAILLIAGDGPLRESYEKYIIENNLKDKVILLGNVTDKHKKDILFNSCDIFVLPSESESFGIVQLEAMQFGKPVINTNLGTGVNYVSIDGETGLTVEPGNVEQLAYAINKLLNNDKLRIELGLNALSRVQNLFNINKTGWGGGGLCLAKTLLYLAFSEFSKVKTPYQWEVNFG